MEVEAVIHDGAVVQRLELRHDMKPCITEVGEDFVKGGLRSVLEARVLDVVDQHGFPVLTIEGSTEDDDSMDRLRNFIESTKFESLFLNIPYGFRGDAAASKEAYCSVMALALTQIDLERVELPVDRYREELTDIFVEAAKSKKMSWSEISLVNTRVEKAESKFVELCSKGVTPLAKDWARIRRNVFSVSIEMVSLISHVIRLCEKNHVKKLTFGSVRISGDGLDAENGNVAHCLADLIQSTKTLEAIKFDRTRMPSDVQEIIAASIVNNETINRCCVSGFYGGQDLLVIIERLAANKRIAFEQMDSYLYPRAFEMFADIIQKRRHVEKMAIGIPPWFEQSSFSPQTDSFLNALESNDPRFKCFLLDGWDLSKVQWKRLLCIFQRLRCDDLRFNLPLPDGWESDFVEALPALMAQTICISSRTQSNVDTNYDLLLHSLKKNYVVESILLGSDKEELTEVENRYEHQLTCYLNWAGRRIELLGPNSFNHSLWPKVLARVNGDGYHKDIDERITLQYSKEDVIFHFLQGPMAQVFSEITKKKSLEKKLM